MSLRFAAITCLTIPLSVASCGAHDDASHGAHDAIARADAGESVADAGAVAADAGTVEDPSVGAPRLDRLMRMQGGLHVMWTNPAARCAFILGERMSAAEPWREVFRVDGAYDNLHEDGMQSGVLYTYRLRCAQGGRVSLPSNEKSATP